MRPAPFKDDGDIYEELREAHLIITTVIFFALVALYHSIRAPTVPYVELLP